MDRTFFRIVTSNPPTREDFLSHRALGRPLTDPARVRQWEGVSVYGTAHQARKKARQYPTLGQYIAELRVPGDAPIEAERTGSSNHHTLWGTPEALLACVVGTNPVAEE